MLVAYNNGSHSTTGFTLTGQNTFEGIAFTNGILNEGGNATLHGPVLADTATMAGNGDTRTILDPPHGAPGAGYDEIDQRVGRRTRPRWADVPGSWKQLSRLAAGPTTLLRRLRRRRSRRRDSASSKC